MLLFKLVLQCYGKDTKPNKPRSDARVHPEPQIAAPPANSRHHQDIQNPKPNTNKHNTKRS